MKKIIYIFGLTFILSLLAAANVSASEGKTTLRNTIGQDATCDAKSALMTDNKYTILITCKDLIYPPSTETNAYVVWATPLSGGKLTRLGSLGYGRAEFRTANPFISLIVSREKVNTQSLGRLSDPTTVVMRGNVDIDPAAPPLIEEGLVEDEIVATPTPRPASSLISKIGTGAIITIVSIVMIIVMLVIVKPFK